MKNSGENLTRSHRSEVGIWTRDVLSSGGLIAHAREHRRGALTHSDRATRTCDFDPADHANVVVVDGVGVEYVYNTGHQALTWTVCYGSISGDSDPVPMDKTLQLSTAFHNQPPDSAHCRYRYNCRGVARWLSRDPIQERGGNNLYGFVGNDAIRANDMLGLIGDPGPDPLSHLLKLRSCQPCECISVEVRYTPGGDTLCLAGYSMGFLDPYRFGNQVRVKWSVSGNPDNCKYFQDEGGTLLKRKRVSDSQTPTNTIGGKDGNVATQEYTDNMGWDFTAGMKGTWDIEVHWNVTFRCVSTSGKTVSRHDTSDLSTTINVPWW